MGHTDLNALTTDQRDQRRVKAAVTCLSPGLGLRDGAEQPGTGEERRGAERRGEERRGEERGALQDRSAPCVTARKRLLTRLKNCYRITQM